DLCPTSGKISISFPAVDIFPPDMIAGSIIESPTTILRTPQSLNFLLFQPLYRASNFPR
ncbi:hypothetical protein J6590_103181, partial [Homalodisca vitripennis]